MEPDQDWIGLVIVATSRPDHTQGDLPVFNWDVLIAHEVLFLYGTVPNGQQ